MELGVLSISIVCYNAPDKKGSQDNTFLMNGIGYSASLEDTGLGGKGGKGGGNEGVPKMVLHDSIYSCDHRRSRIKKDEKLSQKLSRLFLPS